VNIVICKSVSFKCQFSLSENVVGLYWLIPLLDAKMLQIACSTFFIFLLNTCLVPKMFNL